MDKLRIAIVGAGNVAHHLIYRLTQADHYVSAICRSETASNLIRDKFKIETSVNFDSIDEDLVILAVNDDSVPGIEFDALNSLVVHTSGALPLESLSDTFKRRGIFYPLQSLKASNYMDTSIKMPFLINANEKKDVELLKKLAQSIKSETRFFSEEERKHIHLAAVFANNFANHMWNLAEIILARHDLPFEILLPLVQNSVDQIRKELPSGLQTGPAKRKDKITMESQERLLSDIPELAQLYKKISESIAKTSS